MSFSRIFPSKKFKQSLNTTVSEQIEINEITYPIVCKLHEVVTSFTDLENQMQCVNRGMLSKFHKKEGNFTACYLKNLHALLESLNWDKSNDGKEVLFWQLEELINKLPEKVFQRKTKHKRKSRETESSVEEPLAKKANIAKKFSEYKKYIKEAKKYSDEFAKELKDQMCEIDEKCSKKTWTPISNPDSVQIKNNPLYLPPRERFLKLMDGVFNFDQHYEDVEMADYYFAHLGEIGPYSIKELEKEYGEEVADNFDFGDNNKNNVEVMFKIILGTLEQYELILTEKAELTALAAVAKQQAEKIILAEKEEQNRLGLTEEQKQKRWDAIKRENKKKLLARSSHSSEPLTHIEIQIKLIEVEEKLLGLARCLEWHINLISVFSRKLIDLNYGAENGKYKESKTMTISVHDQILKEDIASLPTHTVNKTFLLHLELNAQAYVKYSLPEIKNYCQAALDCYNEVLNFYNKSLDKRLLGSCFSKLSSFQLSFFAKPSKKDEFEQTKDVKKGFFPQ